MDIYTYLIMGFDGYGAALFFSYYELKTMVLNL